MADLNQGGLLKDSTTGALVVQGTAGAAAAGGRVLASVLKNDANGTTTNAAQTAISGLLVSGVVVGARPVIVEFSASGFWNTTAGGFALIDVHMDSTTVVAQSPTQRSIGASDQGNPCCRGLITTLTPGSTHTFQVRIGNLTGTGTATVSSAGGGANGAVLTIREA